MNSENYNSGAKIAYFSMEIAVKNSIKSFSGGLGILAGDTLKSAADLEIPMVGITLLNDQGYFQQVINEDGWQEEMPDSYNKSELEEVAQTYTYIGRDKVQIKAWRYKIEGQSGHTVPVYFLDTDLDGNKEEYRYLTGKLYGGDDRYRLMQEIILGRGGVKLLEELKCAEIKRYHLNEGHAALATIELLSQLKPKPFTLSTKSIEDRANEIREKCVFTTHTPVKAGHDSFSLDMIKELQPDFPYKLSELLTNNKLNMSRLAAYFSSNINGVSKKHGEISRKMFPDYNINSITNGVHSPTWTSPKFKDLFDQFIPDWRKRGGDLRNVLTIDTDKIWEAHKKNKNRLFEYIKKETGKELNPEIFTIGFARRFAAYKRPTLLFESMDKLIEINDTVGKIQIIYAGKAHPNDTVGKRRIQDIYKIMKDYQDRIQIVFLENYDMELGKLITSGVDVWLNNPIPPKEGSGTSGMKAAHNGIPQISTRDGWWLEGCIPGKTGWNIGEGETNKDPNHLFQEDACDLYEKLEGEIIPTYYDNRDEWKRIMRQTIATNAAFFNSNRMLLEYVQKTYL